MATISTNSFVVDTQDLASAKFRKIQEEQARMVTGAISGNGRLAASTQKLAATQNSARMATFSLTQAIQDAPYGFRGVANNIEFLTQNLVTLTAQTGGAMGAMKAIGATLSGPVGILFAISAVSSAIQFLAPQLGQMGQSAENQAASINKLKTSIVDLEFALGRLTRAEYLNNLQADISIAKNEERRLSRVKSSVSFFGGHLLPSFSVAGTTAERLAARQATLEAEKKFDEAQKGLGEKDEKAIKETTDRHQKYLDFLTKQGDEAQKQFGRLFLIDPLTGGKIFSEGSDAIQRFQDKITALRNPGLLPNVRESRPGSLDRVTPDELISAFQQLGTTVQNVNGLIIASTQSAAAAMVDAFFGATKSIGQFFENLVKQILTLLTEQLLVKGIFAALGSFLGPVGVIGGAVAGSAGVSRSGAGESFTVYHKVQGGTVEQRNAIMRSINRAAQEERFG